MRRYWFPDYEKKLIGELQRQQNSAEFCDTLLQTEGISIPTHSSVLAALSRHLSERLPSSPSYPAGQKCRLQLHALKPQILIKLIGLLYSGELEVSGAVEQRDVLAAAHLFGLPDLVEGEKVEVRNDHNGCKDCKRVEFEKRDAQIQVTPRSFCVSTGTQTITEDANQTMENSEHQEAAFIKRLPLFAAPQSCSSVETTCSVNSKTYSEEESILEQSISATVCLSCPSENMKLQLSPTKESSCSRLQEGEAQPTQPETSGECVIGNPVVVEEEEEDEKKNDRQRKVPKDKEKTNEGTAVVEKRQVRKKVATKSLEKMQEMMETTQISIKVKLRRRGTMEEIWEVVNLQDPDALSGATSLRTDHCKMSQGDLTAVQPSTSTDQAPEPVTSSPKPGLHTSDISESVSAPSGDPVLLQLSHPVEETEEQIEQLLEDIMTGLNILPNIDKRNDKSRDLDLSHEGYEDQNGNSSTETGESGCTVHPPSKPCSTKSDLSLNNPCTSDGRRDSPQNSPCPTTFPCLLTANPGLNPPEDPNVLELLHLSTENEDNLFSMSDLQFLPCLSPLDSNNNSNYGNKSPAHLSVPGQTWLMHNPRSLQFPLTAVIASTSSGCKEAGSNDEPNAQLGKKRKVSKVCRTLEHDGTPHSAKSRCPNLGLNKTCSDLKMKTDANINFSHCLVSLSSNNVLAKERKSPTFPLPSNVSELQTQITKCLRPKTKTIGDTSRKTPVRTRRKSQRSDSTPEMAYPNPEMSKNGRKRGRPRKRAVNRGKSKQQIQNTSLEKSDEVPSQAKRLRLEEDIDDDPSKQVMPIDSSFDAKTDDNNIAAAEKRPRMVSLKDFQELIKRKHLKTQGTKDKSEKEQSEKAKKYQRGNAVMADSVWETSIASIQSDNTDVKEDRNEQTLSSPLSNQLSNDSKTPPPVDNSTSSISEFNNLSENSDESEICFSVIPEEVTKVSEEMEEAMPKLIDNGVTDSASENELIIDDSFQHIVTREENYTPANSSNLSQSKNNDSENSKETEPSTRGSSCLQDEEEDVDILLHSPDRTFVTTEGQKSVESPHDEEEEEDSNDVDVTGSETDA